MSIFPTSTRETRRLVRRAAHNAHGLVDQAADRIGPAVERVQDGIGQARDVINQRAEQIGDIEDQWIATVRAYPWTALAGAVAFGILLGSLRKR